MQLNNKYGHYLMQLNNKCGHYLMQLNNKYGHYLIQLNNKYGHYLMQLNNKYGHYLMQINNKYGHYSSIIHAFDLKSYRTRICLYFFKVNACYNIWGKISSIFSSNTQCGKTHNNESV